METTYFKNGINNIVPDKNVTFADIFKGVKGGTWAGQTNQVRILQYGSKEYKEAKNKLSYFTPHGTITDKRKDENIVSLSNIFCFDIDAQDNPQLLIEDLKLQLRSDEFVYCYFDSPSGLGVKVFVKTRTTRQTFKPDYEGAVDFFTKRWYVKLDKGQGKLSQPCYISFDKNLYLYEQASEYIPETNRLSGIKFDNETRSPFDIAKHILEKDGIHFAEGNKHNYLFEFSSILNRFGVPKDETIAYINSMEHGVIKTNCVDYPYKVYASQFGTTKIEMPEKQTKKQEPQPKPKEVKPNTDSVYNANDIMRIMLGHYDNGWPRAQSTGFHFMDDCLNFMKGWLYLLYGYASVGKSSFQKYLMVQSAKEYGNKFGIWAFEELTTRYIDTLVQCYVGTNTMDGWKDRCTRNEYIEGLKFIMEHFYFIDVTKANDMPTIEANFQALHDKHNLFGVSLDPINQISLPNYSHLPDKWSDFYRDRKIFALKNDVCYLNIGHSIKPMIDESKEYPMPDLYSVDGGAQHPNKNDVMYCYHRPNFRANPKDTLTLVRVWKVKDHKTAGEPAIKELVYNRASGHYLKYNGSPTF